MFACNRGAAPWIAAAPAIRNWMHTYRRDGGAQLSMPHESGCRCESATDKQNAPLKLKPAERGV